ncbi:hypothetical protein [Psychromonas antarctica]|uniref:hypothetical protein n=1 Tax=Psychromonas antarctica TaxID=67573 RepID=UPI001EE7AC0B|nr:hypothetical protein [Psychromonas antarctica]MCG6200635.1 hypothetical protein [Psychromonas antarctica]
MNAALDVFTRLSLTDESGNQILVNADNEIISVMLPSLKVARTLLKQLSNCQQRAWIIANFHRGLNHADLIFEFQIAHRIIARIGPHTTSGVFSRMAGFGPVELKIIAILQSLLKR